MNICFVTYEYPPYIFGGSGTYASLLIKGLEKFDVNIHLITHGPENVFKDNFSQINTPDLSNWRRLYFSYYAQKLVDKLNEKKDFDLIHYNEPHILISTVKKPIISTFHSTQLNEFRVNLQPSMRHHVNFFNVIPKNLVGSMGDILSARKTNIIICPCLDLKKYIHKYCFKDEESIKVILNGIDVSTYEFDLNNDVLKKYALEKDNYILFVGRLDPIKGIDVLINAYNKVCINFPRIKLAIMGSGDFEKDLRKLSRNKSNIVFLGHISDVYEKNAIIKNSTLLVLPSYYEALPMVVLEAMAAGKPVIATKTGGTPEVVEEGINGLLVSPGDQLELSVAIEKLLGSSDTRIRMSKQNLEKAKEKFGYLEMARQVYSVYKQILDKEKFKS